MSGENVRHQFEGTHGGTESAELLAVVCLRDNSKVYRLPSNQDHEVIEKTKLLRKSLQRTTDASGFSLFPNEPLPYLRSIFNVNLIGMDKWEDLFSARQIIAISTLSQKIGEVDNENKELDPGFKAAVATLLAFVLDRQADYCTSICTWVQTGEFIGHNFAQGQSLPIKWDFAEVVPLSNGSGSWDGAVDWVARVVENISAGQLSPGVVERISATSHILPDDNVSAFVTDPPYYDAVPYADLSDFFYVWLKRSLSNIHGSLFEEELTPKRQEVVQLAERNKLYSYKTKDNFESLMKDALSEGRRITSPSSIGIIVFAHKETSAWETMLQAVLDAGWVVTASWAIDTERSGRLRAMKSAALASSVHLVCRPRENSDGTLRTEIGDWRDVLQELPQRIHDWMPRLAQEGVVGADAIFACLGPALEIFSRYSSVEKASGEEVTLREYLEYVWGAVSKEALGMIFTDADTTDFEEDARLTAMWLWTLSAGNDAPGTESGVPSTEDDDDDSKPVKSTGYTLEYDAARKIAQGLGAHLDKLTTLVEVKGDKARLLPVGERAQALFGKEDLNAPTTRRKKKSQDKQLDLFAILGNPEDSDSGSFGDPGVPQVGKTVLDRLHQSMILFAAGRSEALKRFLVEEGIGADQRYWKLAQAFSALYPTGTDEKRWVDGVLARKKGLGF